MKFHLKINIKELNNINNNIYKNYMIKLIN